jgi:hypothetical protein
MEEVFPKSQSCISNIEPPLENIDSLSWNVSVLIDDTEKVMAERDCRLIVKKMSMNRMMENEFYRELAK